MMYTLSWLLALFSCSPSASSCTMQQPSSSKNSCGTSNASSRTALIYLATWLANCWLGVTPHHYVSNTSTCSKSVDVFSSTVAWSLKLVLHSSKALKSCSISSTVGKGSTKTFIFLKFFLVCLIANLLNTLFEMVNHSPIIAFNSSSHRPY
jgi:hypothetical protein